MAQTLRMGMLMAGRSNGLHLPRSCARHAAGHAVTTGGNTIVVMGASVPPPLRPVLRARRGGSRRACVVRGAASGAEESLGPNPPPNRTPWVKFCSSCGGPVRQEVPEGENVYRPVCVQCDKIEYINPKQVVGCLVEHEGKVLLCRRAIEPCYGLWTLPAGYMELDESTAAGAARETWEEANAKVKVTAPYAYMDIPRIGQSYIIFRASLEAPFTFGAGTESLDVELFALDEIPFDQIAFSAIAVVLQHYIEDVKGGFYHVHHAVIDKKAGSSPSDPNGYEVQDHIKVPTATRVV